jgi:hypothetical protein
MTRHARRVAPTEQVRPDKPRSVAASSHRDDGTAAAWIAGTVHSA